MSRSNFSQISSLSNPSLSPISDSLSLASSQGVLKELMDGMGWHDISGSVREHESKYQQDKLTLQAAVEHYESDQNFETAGQLLSALDDHLAALKKEHQRALEQQRHYKKEAEKEVVISTVSQSSRTWTQWFQQGVSSIRYFFDSTPQQLAEKYEAIAKQRQDQINQVLGYRKRLQQGLKADLLKEKSSDFSSKQVKLDKENRFQLQSTQTMMTPSECASKRRIFGGYNPIINLTELSYYDYGLIRIHDLYPLSEETIRDADDADNPFVASSYNQFIIAWNTINSSSVQALPVDASSGQFYLASQPPFFNSSLGSSGQTHPVVGVFRNQQVVIAWDGEGTTNKGIYAKCFSPAGIAGLEFQVNDIAQNGSHAYPAIATLGDSFVIAWSYVNNLGNNTMLARFYNTAIDYSENRISCNNSLAITGDMKIASYAGYALNDSPDITVTYDQNGVGTYYFAWAGAGKDKSLYVRPFSVKGLPLRAEYKSDAIDVAPKSRPSIEVGSNEQLIVAWQQFFTYSNDSDIWGQSISALGSEDNLGFPAQPSVPIAVSYADETHVTLGVFTGGNFVAVWQVRNASKDNGCFETYFCPTALYARFFQDIQTPLTNWYCIIGADVTTYQLEADVDVFLNGDFVLASVDQDHSLSYLYYTNQPPFWDTSKLNSSDPYSLNFSKSAGSPWSVPLSNYLKSYDNAGLVKDLEGSTVTCSAYILASDGKACDPSVKPTPLSLDFGQKSYFLKRKTFPLNPVDSANSVPICQ